MFIVSLSFNFQYPAHSCVRSPISSQNGTSCTLYCCQLNVRGYLSPLPGSMVGLESGRTLHTSHLVGVNIPFPSDPIYKLIVGSCVSFYHLLHQHFLHIPHTYVRMYAHLYVCVLTYPLDIRIKDILKKDTI